MDDRPTTRALFALVALLLALGTASSQGEGELPEVISLVLIDADRNEALFELEDGATLDFSALGTRNLSVDARTRPRRVGSVVFSLNDEEMFQLENVEPYAIAGDGEGGTDFYPWTPPLGENVLTATPYSERNAAGQRGVARTVRFTVVEHSELGKRVLRASPARTPRARRVPAAPAAARSEALEAYATLRPARVALNAQGAQRGTVLLTDYGRAGTTLAVVLTGGAAVGAGSAHLGVGGCESAGAALLALDALEGGTSITPTPLRYEGLMAGDFHIRIAPDEAPGDVLCGELNGAGRLP